MKFRITDHFHWPAEKIIDILSTGEDLVPPEKLPNVSSRKVIELKKDGRNFKRTTEWCVHGQIPKVAQKILRPEMLTFVEQSIWNAEDSAFTTRIIPHFLKDTLKCTSYSRWMPDGASTTRRDYEGEVEIKIPVIGPLCEKTIVDYLKKNTEENAIMVKSALTERLGPPSK